MPLVVVLHTEVLLVAARSEGEEALRVEDLGRAMDGPRASSALLGEERALERPHGPEPASAPHLQLAQGIARGRGGEGVGRNDESGVCVLLLWVLCSSE